MPAFRIQWHSGWEPTQQVLPVLSSTILMAAVVLDPDLVGGHRFGWASQEYMLAYADMVFQNQSGF